MPDGLYKYPPGLFPPGDPVYGIPPDEFRPEVTFSWTALSEGRDWSHAVLGIPELHAKGIMGEGCLIAILDTGVDYEHEDLKDQMASEGHKDFTGSQFGWKDVQSHGTHCSAIAAAAINDKGLAGIAPKGKILGVKVLNDQGSGSSSWINNGIRYAAECGADIISLSLGGPYPDEDGKAAIAYAISLGCWVVCAAGNDGRAARNFPGHYPASFAVVATDKDNKRANFSTINEENDISAPGVKITAATPKNTYSVYSGTSMATPAVAGCLALVRGYLKKLGVPILSQNEMVVAVKKTAKSLNGGVDQVGAGLIDTAALLGYLTPVTLPPKPPTVSVIELLPVDLTDSGKEKLRAAGLTRFSIQV